MEQLVFRNLDNTEIWDHIVDKRFAHILLHRFRPHSAIEWVKSSILLNNGLQLENIAVRQLEFDLFADLPLFNQILNSNTLYLHAYQFDRPVPDTLLIDSLPKLAVTKILKINGLQHVIFNELEDTIVKSYDLDFIKGLHNNQVLYNRIVSQSSLP